MAQRKKVLFLTNSEHGQANVILAVAHEVQIQGQFDVHIASFHDLQLRVTQLDHFVRNTASSLGDANPITFHEIAGPSMMEAFCRDAEVADLTHSPGIKGAILSYKKALDVVYAWDGPEYIRGFQSCLEIVKETDPVVVVVDNGFTQAIDVCNVLLRKYILVTPASMKDVIGILQPRLAVLWKYPMLSSGFPFPLPWYYIPANIYLFILLLLTVIFNPRVRRIASHRKSHGIPKKQVFLKDVPYLCPALPEIEFPYVIPSNVTSCGPILPAVRSVSESDLELANWLRTRPTILLNLGSHIVSNARCTRELASGLRVMLDRFPDIQILWKLKSGRCSNDSVSEILAEELTSGQVRIEKWLTTDPLAILQSGHVICSVHHGGANSFFEATATGVPQVVLPVWLDTYDFAVRAEWLGIGINGNRSVAPEVDAAEFSDAVATVIGQNRDTPGSFYKRAESLANVCRKNDGRAVACRRIMEMAQEDN